MLRGTSSAFIFWTNFLISWVLYYWYIYYWILCSYDSSFLHFSWIRHQIFAQWPALIEEHKTTANSLNWIELDQKYRYYSYRKKMVLQILRVVSWIYSVMLHRRLSFYSRRKIELFKFEFKFWKGMYIIWDQLKQGANRNVNIFWRSMENIIPRRNECYREIQS